MNEHPRSASLLWYSGVGFLMWFVIMFLGAATVATYRYVNPTPAPGLPAGYTCAPIDQPDGIYRCWNPDLANTGG